MKKLMFFVVGLLTSITVYSQSLDDVWQCLRQNQAPKAKKFLESYMANHPDEAQAWLMKGNVYINLFSYDVKKKEADPNYTPRYPDAIEIANEAFIKALELDNLVKAKTGMLGAQEGQALLADDFLSMGFAAKDAGNTEKALKYFSTAAKGYEIGKNTQSAAVAYFQEAIVYKDNNDRAKEKELMLKVIKNNSRSFAGAYIELFDIYKAENDTVNCEKIIKQAKSNLDPKLIKVMYDIELDYLSMLNDQAGLCALCDSIMAKTTFKEEGDTLLIANCANYLTNIGALTKAEELLNAALVKVPNDYKLFEQMAYRYYQEMFAYDKQKEDLQAKKDWTGVTNLIKADSEWSINRNKAIEKAHEWAEKAFQLKDTRYDNLANNRRLKQLKTLLKLPIPQELDDAIKARMQN